MADLPGKTWVVIWGYHPFNGIKKESEGLLTGGTTSERILACYDKFWEAASSS